jgi:hypothetical protein
LNGLIVRTRKTHILMIFDEMHLGELLAHHTGTIIGGGVIDHSALKWRSWGICQDGGKTIFQKPSGVPAHDNVGNHILIF